MAAYRDPAFDPGGDPPHEYLSSHLWYEANRDDATPPAINRETFEHEKEWAIEKAQEIAGGGGAELPEKQLQYITTSTGEISQ